MSLGALRGISLKQARELATGWRSILQHSLLSQYEKNQSICYVFRHGYISVTLSLEGYCLLLLLLLTNSDISMAKLYFLEKLLPPAVELFEEKLV